LGYHPDFDFLRALGIELVTEQNRPVCDPQTLESNVSREFFNVAGVIVAGLAHQRKSFIENGRFHGN